MLAVARRGLGRVQIEGRHAPMKHHGAPTWSSRLCSRRSRIIGENCCCYSARQPHRSAPRRRTRLNFILLFVKSHNATSSICHKERARTSRVARKGGRHMPADDRSNRPTVAHPTEFGVGPRGVGGVVGLARRVGCPACFLHTLLGGSKCRYAYVMWHRVQATKEIARSSRLGCACVWCALNGSRKWFAGCIWAVGGKGGEGRGERWRSEEERRRGRDGNLCRMDRASRARILTWR